MGRRSINTTKSGKFMNPTDQARKEARKRELKKNKRQRMTVRHAVLKSKDPMQILEEIELIDQLEYDPMNPPTFNEKVLKEKRKKLKETFYRVLKLYEKEDPEYSVELKKSDFELDRKREKLQVYFEQVKNTERVQVDQIPLPENYFLPSETGMIPLPDDKPHFLKPVRGILKHAAAYRLIEEDIDISFETEDVNKSNEIQRAPPSPPPGLPPPLSDSEDEEYDPEKGIEENLGDVRVNIEPPSLDDIPEPEFVEDESRDKTRKIRFIDDETYDSSAPEKDTRIKFKSNMSALQMKMLQIAGQQPPPSEIDMPSSQPPPPGLESEDGIDLDEISSRPEVTYEESDSDDEHHDEDSEIKRSRAKDKFVDNEDNDDYDDDDDEDSLIPPGPPPGRPPMLPPPGAVSEVSMSMGNRAPMVRPMTAGPLRGIGMPPGPPPGLPPGVRGIPSRMPPGMPMMLPRMIRPLGGPMGVPPPNIPLPPSIGHPVSNIPPVLSAPPNIMKPSAGSDEVSDRMRRTTATIEAKPQIKQPVGEVTRFTPTSLKVKRQIRDSKGRLRQIGKDEEKVPGVIKKPVNKSAPQSKTKDYAYEEFMKEMSGLM